MREHCTYHFLVLPEVRKLRNLQNGGLLIRKIDGPDSNTGLVEHRTAVRGGRGFKPRTDQHSGSLNN